MNRDDPDDRAVAALLAPIAGGTGRDVRPEGDYDRIAEARRDENASLPRGVWVREIKQADWPLVERLCTGILTGKSKDLRVACWLCEAWVHVHGFSGLSAGILVLHGLCRDFWPDLYPSLDGADASARLAAFDWLNERMPAALRQVPILVDATQPMQGFNWADCLAAARLDVVRNQDTSAAQKAEAAGAVTSAMIDARRERTDTAWLNTIEADLDTAMGALAALDQALDALCGRDAPGFGKIRRVCTEIADFVSAAAAGRQIVPAPAPVSADPLPVLPVAPAPTSPALTRDDAYRQLELIANFLRRSEPHSPVADVLDVLVSWRDLSAPELEAALRQSGSGVSILLDALGFNPSQDS
jgi:type VI secretion system ImpA family protein